MALFNLHRRPVDAPVEAAPLLAPRASLDGWDLPDGSPLARRLPRSDSRELATLLHCVAIRVDTPWTYERAVELLDRGGDPAQALAVCEAWFSMPAADHPVNAGRSRALAKRRGRLRTRLTASVPSPREA